MDRKDFQITVAFNEKICRYQVRTMGIGRYVVFGKNRSVTISLDHKLISGQMNQLCVNILAEAIGTKSSTSLALIYHPCGRLY